MMRASKGREERWGYAVKCWHADLQFRGKNSFKAFCQTLWVSLGTCNLWVNYTQRAINTLRIQYNNEIRVLVEFPCYCSAFAMFAHAHANGFHTVLRRHITSLMFRTRGSANTILNVFSQKLDSTLLGHWRVANT